MEQGREGREQEPEDSYESGSEDGNNSDEGHDLERVQEGNGDQAIPEDGGHLVQEDDGDQAIPEDEGGHLDEPEAQPAPLMGPQGRT